MCQAVPHGTHAATKVFPMSKRQSATKHISKTKAPVKLPTPRKLATPKRQLRKPSTWKRPKPLRHPLPKARHILRDSVERIGQAKRPIYGVTLLYGVGVALLVRGFSTGEDITAIKSMFDGLLNGASGKLQSILLQLTVLFSGSNQGSMPNASLYQTVLLLVCSLALIWIFRQSQAKHTVTAKLAFYQGMDQIIPFLIVLSIIGIQLVPLGVGSYLYSSLIGAGIAVYTWEKFLTVGLFLLLGLWSLRMLTSSLFAMYIVTLPNMTPLRAIRSAKELVRGRRLIIWRKLLLLPFVLTLGTSLIVLPFLLFLTPLTVWVFFFLSTAWFAMTHSYLYSLYRELLKDA